MKHLIGFALGAFVLLAGVRGAGADDAPAAGEHLVVSPYPSDPPWKRTVDPHDKEAEVWIPADQASFHDTQDLLTIMTFAGMPNSDPAKVARDLAAAAQSNCQSARVNGPTPQTENGFAVAYIQIYCANFRASHMDVDSFIKVMGGKDTLYLVQRIFRRPGVPGGTPGIATFSADQLGALRAKVAAQATANDFLVKSVQLCPASGGGGLCAAP